MSTAVLGLQWGDEGKGKITHLLAREADMVVRFNGGPNAGHTLIDRGVKFGTHLIPAGAFYPGVTSVLAAGMVVDIELLSKEIRAVADHIGETPRVLLAENAHLILPYHRTLEELEGSGARFGTTRRGIAPAYRDKVAHVGVRAGDLLDPETLRSRIAWRLDLLKREWPASEEMQAYSAGALAELLLAAGKELREGICDVSPVVDEALRKGKRVLFEGAQGTLLDVDFGTYPFVTSSTTTFGGIGPSLGIPLPSIDRRVGVAKAYLTRVGEGPFPTELENPVGAGLRERGGEYGTTTGRPRRCGWLDLVALRYAATLNGITEIALTKLDVLNELDEIRVCTEYRIGGRSAERYPLSGERLARCEPVYEAVRGWREALGNPTSVESLPKAAANYVRLIEKKLEIRVGIVSYGPRPEETIGTTL
ncbi:MAG: adenylosuccinate synthase [Candidatus Bipolaricaulota bacterium]|nr:adenylosuccinate synthase [Candidatus Bipolaricaulota bacterium]